MDQYLKILLVEDSNNDVKLITHELNKNLVSDLHFVDDEENFINEIKSFQPEIILSDYNLPTFDGLKALAISQKLCPNIPFILVTGSINEETAVECIKAGADDYIIKENLKRLFPAMTSALEKRKLIHQKEIAEEKFRILSLSVEQSPVSVVITDASGNIEFVNPKFCEITGYAYDEVIGKNPKILNSGETSKNDYDKLWKTILSGKVWEGEFHNKKKNGELFWERAIISPLIKDGVITHLVAVKEDINEQKKMLHDLVEAKDKAEELSRLKSNFIANMSHELRTPLVGLLGISEFLKLELSGKQKENAEVIYISGLRLLKTINEILTFSKLESERPVVNKLDFDVSKMILFHTNHQQSLYRKHVEIDFDLPGKPLIFYTDPKLLEQIFDNLLSNAFKFTDSGKVIISAEENDKELVISIKDSGIGIPPEKFQQIFEDFRQVSEGYGRNFEGMGIGLTIAKKYADMLEGHIEVESELNKGSVFSIHLPVKEKARKTEFPISNLLKILIVEDDYINALTIKKMLEKKYSIHEAHNGISALDICSKEKIDIILMDINLRHSIDGIQTTKQIREIPGYELKPVVAMTAYALPSDKEQFLRSGFSHYLAKPFAYEDLILLVESITSNAN